MAAAIIGPKFYGWDDNGDPLAYGKLYTYEPGTTTPKPTYKNENGQVENTNPVILNASGWANVHLEGSYAMLLTDADDNEIWSEDPVTDASDQINEWIRQTNVEYVDPSTFRALGNQTEVFSIGRAVQVNDVTLKYGSVVSAEFSAGYTIVSLSISEPLTTSISWVRVGIFTEASFPQSAISVNNVNSIADLPGISNPSSGKQTSVKGWHPDSDVGGGILYWDASKPKSEHNGGTVFSPTVPWTTTTADYLNGVGETDPSGSGCWVRTNVEYLTPEMFGAKSDGATDDTASIQASLVGAKVVIDGSYLVTTISVSSPVKIEGTGSLSRGSVRSDAVISITSDDVDISGITFIGSFGRSTPTGSNTADNAIECQGSTTPDRLKRIKVSNCEIYGFLGFGIRMNYAEDVICSHNVINYCGYAGILYESVFNGVITENQISFIEDSSGGDAYGISLSRDPTINLTNAAKSKNCVVSNNIVSEIPTWTGIDCHAAEKSIIEANVVSECANGIVLQYDSASATFRAECNDISVINNQVFGRSTASENEIGISSLGLAALPNINITIQGNLVRGCGDYNSTNGAIYVNETQGAVVKDNRIDRSIRHGIGIKGSSTFFVVEGNVVDGVIDGDVASNRSYVYIDLTGTSGTFRGNRFLNNTGDANYDPVYGIWYNGSSSAVIMSKNRMRDLTGSSFLYDGTANRYSDLAWELEDNSALLSAQALTAGNTQEIRNLQVRRNMYGTFGTHILATANIYPFATNKIAAVVSGFFDIDELEILIYTVDGTTFGSAFVTGAMVQISSICWED